VRFTLRRTLIAVAGLGIGLAAVRFYFLDVDPFFGFGTVYSRGTVRVSSRAFVWV
jgi:hypothetical protein